MLQRNPLMRERAPTLIHFCSGQTLQQYIFVRHAVPCEFLSELEILGSASDVLGDGKIVHFKAETNARTGGRALHFNESSLPARRQNRSLRADTLGIKPVVVMKRRTFANRSVDLVR